MGHSRTVSIVWAHAQRSALEAEGWTFAEQADGSWIAELGKGRAVYGETLAELIRRINSR